MKILIAGSGPSAAYAILACRDLGVEPTVISKEEPNLGAVGAFFLHWLPESFVARNACLTYPVHISSIGSSEIYSCKQWHRVVGTSFPDKPSIQQWYSSAELNRIWKECNLQIELLNTKQLVDYCSQFDVVFHSFPLREEKGNRALSVFRVTSFYTPFESLQNYIQYDGTEENPWVRETSAFGRISREYGAITGKLNSRKYVVTFLRDIAPEILPISSSDWLAANLVPIGRYATWDRKMLSHQTYDIVKHKLESR